MVPLKNGMTTFCLLLAGWAWHHRVLTHQVLPLTPITTSHSWHLARLAQLEFHWPSSNLTRGEMTISHSVFLSQPLPSQNIFCASLPGWTCEINPIFETTDRACQGTVFNFRVDYGERKKKSQNLPFKVDMQCESRTLTTWNKCKDSIRLVNNRNLLWHVALCNTEVPDVRPENSKHTGIMWCLRCRSLAEWQHNKVAEQTVFFS